MLYRLFLMLLALNLATMFTQAHADDLDRHLLEISADQIGTDNANSLPSAVRTGDCVKRVLGMLGNEWLKDLVGIQRAAEEPSRDFSLGGMLQESEYDVRISGDDVLVRMTYHF